MKLATLRNGTPDGKLIIVSPDGHHFADAPVATLQAALESWTAVEPALRAVVEFPQALELAAVAAPLPRAWQWLDGSAFNSHGELMQIAFGMDPIDTSRPLMYQGVSDRFYGPHDDVPFTSEADGIDFEGEFGVIVGAVPMGVSAEAAMRYIRLIVQINDWSLRRLAPLEMKTGFGWVQAKPPCSVAPFAVTPDELGEAWRDGRVCLPLAVDWDGQRFGDANGDAMAFGFHELVAHAAYSRDLVAGTIIGSGTVSNANYRDVGSSCIAERRAIELVDRGESITPFLSFGSTVRMEARSEDDALLFGAIKQKVARA